jgi:16S rRNA (guanine(966)-N(2))-methyltransferase RsmD
MRITAGLAKGREVPLPRGVELRPTSDKVKQALFNVLGPSVSGARVLDLFCGSGNLGLEALSRGAASCVFVDRERRCVEAARAASGLFGLKAEQEFVVSEAEAALRRFAAAGRQFDLILVDPPYAGGLGQSLLQSPYLVAILAKTAASRLVWEHDSKQSAPPLPVLSLLREYPHGGTSLTFFGIGPLADRNP